MCTYIYSATDSRIYVYILFLITSEGKKKTNKVLNQRCFGLVTVFMQDVIDSVH